MDARYLNATTILPAQEIVCGRTLFPLCLRHRVVLESIDSPFIKEKATEITPYDVVIACRIMSTYDMAKMVGKLSLRETIEVVRMKYSKKRLLDNVIKIYGVIKVSCSYPKLWEKKDNKKNHKIGVPWPLTTVANLCRNGIDSESAWTMPEAQAVWLCVANAVYNGSKIDVLTTDEEESLKNFHETVNKYKEQQKKKEEQNG